MKSPAFLAALLAIITWAGAPVANKLAVGGMGPLELTLVRCLLSGASGLVLALVLRIPLPRRNQVGLLAVSGIGGFSAASLVYSYGLQSTSGVHASMITAISPLVTGLVALTWERRLPTWRWWIGCFIAIAGEAVLVLHRTDGGTASIIGDLFLILASLVAAIAYVAGGRLGMTGYPAMGSCYWGAAIAGIVMAPVSFYVFPQMDFAPVETRAWISILYLALGCVLIGYTLWYWALSRAGMEKIGLVQFLQPILSLIAAAIILDEPMTIEVYISGVLVFAGVWIATRRPSLAAAG